MDRITPGRSGARAAGTYSAAAERSGAGPTGASGRAAARPLAYIRRAAPVYDRLALVPGGDNAGWVVNAEDLPDGLVLADHRGRVTAFNGAAARLTGTDPAKALGADVRDVLPLRDRDGRDWWACMNPYGGLATRTRHPEMSLFLPGGTEVLVTVGYNRDQYGGHRVCRLVICMRGAAGLARLERSRADLVSTVAHELRSPLTSVKGFTATLLAKWHRFTDDQKRVMLETVNADADRVTRLITELLDVSRIEAGRLEVHRQVVDIAERARNVIAGRVAAGENPARFKLEEGAGVPEMWLDTDKIDQVLGNLIENALRHGDGTVTIVVQAAPNAGPDGGATVSVRDQGEGIAPELAPRVFRQFWRAKRRGGAGLGLYIVKGLIEAHGGIITVQTPPGGGAEFRFTLPTGTPDFA